MKYKSLMEKIKSSFLTFKIESLIFFNSFSLPKTPAVALEYFIGHIKRKKNKGNNQIKFKPTVLKHN